MRKSLKFGQWYHVHTIHDLYNQLIDSTDRIIVLFNKYQLSMYDLFLKDLKKWCVLLIPKKYRMTKWRGCINEHKIHQGFTKWFDDILLQGNWDVTQQV